MANAPIERDLAARLGRPGAWSFEVPSLELDWSDEARAILGVEQDGPFSFDNARALVHPDWRAPCALAFSECIKQGRSFDLEFQGYTARGALVWVRLIGEASRDSHGRTHRVSGAVQDITERRNAAERFLELSQRMKHTYESVTDSFFTLDRQWRFTYVNGAAERVLKRPREELLGQLAWTVFPGAREGPFHSQYERAMVEGATVEFEAYSDILPGWLKVVAYPSVQGLAVYSKDITDSRRVRQELVDSEERYRLLFQTSADAIFQQTGEGRILSANPAACAMLGMSEVELCQLDAGAIIAPEEQRALALRDIRRNTGNAVGELRIMRKDGKRIAVEVSTAEHCTEDGRTVVNTILRDVSKRLLQEQEIRQRNADLASRVQQRTAELEAANAELRSFAHSLAHDLRAPIATIEGFSAMLAESIDLSGVNAGQHYVKRIRAASKQMNEFVDALLSLAKVSQTDLHVEDVDLTALARDLLSDLQAQSPDRALHAAVQDGMVARGDARLLKVAMENLIGNAWKFSGKTERAEISVTAQLVSGDTVYSVKDNGAGFDMEYADKLFGNFQRLHSHAEFPGTGIGLVNVRRIVERHGGRIWATAVEGQGATFRFTLARPAPHAT